MSPSATTDSTGTRYILLFYPPGQVGPRDWVDKGVTNAERALWM